MPTTKRRRPKDSNLDGCDLDFAEDPDDEQTAELRPLFPDGKPHNKWEGVDFNG